MLRTKWVPGAAAAIAVMLLTAGAAFARPLSVEVWTDRGDDAVYRPGENMQVKARTSDDSYLLVYEIDSEGNISVLYPWRRAAGMVEGRRTYRLPPEDSKYELAVEGETGQGYLVAIASREPFRDLPWYLRPFDPQGESIGYENRHDEEEGFDEQGRVLGDPMVAIERIRREVLGRPGDTDNFATSYASYYVGHEVRYPRYICYDCHRPNHYAWWDGFDPYYTNCSVFDFRVNWNWCWGPCLWSGHVPYYYYVVRSDCPPHYRRWYDDHSRWSSWDGRRTWDNLWGGPLTRYKSAPPVGYTPPTRGGDNPRGTPPGWIEKPMTRNTGGRQSLPIGRNRPDWGEGSQRPSGGPVWRTPAGEAPAKPEGGRTPPDERKGDRGSAPSDKPVERPQPRYEPPQRKDPPRETPKFDPPRRDPPRQEQPRKDPPRQEQPRKDPPKQDSPKQDPPRHDSGSSGGTKHKGGGGF
jgi:hypothetical protein